MAGKRAKPTRKRAVKKAAPRKAGRPSKYTPALLDDICDRLRKGEPLAQICRDQGMPHPSTVRDWADKDEAVSLAIARAREDGEDWLAAECLQIADTPMPGVIEKQELLGVMKRAKKDGDEEAYIDAEAKLVVTERKVEDMLGHRKLQIDTRLKLLAKFNPKKWGDKVDVNHGAQSSLEQLILASMAQERVGSAG